MNFGMFNAGGPFWNVMISVGFLVGTLHQGTHAGEKDQETRENGGGCQARKGVRLHSLAAVPSGKHTKNYGKSQFLMGTSTISMVIFNSYFDITRG